MNKNNNKPFYLIAGMGKTGLSVARYLKKKQYEFAVFDTREKPPQQATFTKKFPEIEIFVNKVPEKILDSVDVIIASPGLSLNNDLFLRAFQKGIIVYGDIECLAREVSAPILAVTGTNGKTTVSTLVGEMAEAAGLKVAVAGNIGTPALDLLLDNRKYDLWVLELSSFQLQLIYSLRTLGSAILNISPDHLDWHQSFDAYKAAKHRIFQHTKTMIYNRDEQQTHPIFESVLHKHTVTFGSDLPSKQEWGLINQSAYTYLAQGKDKILDVNELGIKGVHNWLNALAACALAESVGIQHKFMIQALKNFSGLPHRCQWIRTLEGVEWIDDSKGTNVGATLSAISGLGEAITGKIVLIAGGQSKKAEFSTLVPAVRQYVKYAVLLGQEAKNMQKALEDSTATDDASDMKEAVKLAHAKASAGDMVLLSPACASMDMFRDFNHRGEVFTERVNEL